MKLKKTKRAMSMAMAVMMAVSAAACGKSETSSNSADSASSSAQTESKDNPSSAETQAKTDPSGASGEGQTITFWHSMGGVNGEAIDYLVKKFNEENTKNIKVDAQYQGSYDDAINKLKSAQIGNMGADLVQI